MEVASDVQINFKYTSNSPRTEMELRRSLVSVDTVLEKRLNRSILMNSDEETEGCSVSSRKWKR